MAPSATSAVVLTNYGYSNIAWATQVVGGRLPAGSGETAHIVTGCTRKAGIDKSNDVAGINLGGMVKVNGVKSDSKTYRDAKGHHSWSENYLAKVDLGDGAAVIKGLTTTSHAWVDKAGKYHADSKISGIIKIGSAPAIELPDPGTHTIPIPGVGRIVIGDEKTTIGANGAHNLRTALIVELSASDSTVRVGRAAASIVGGVTQGVMGGRAYGSNVTLLNGTVTSGKTARLGLPCRGTNGRWLNRNTAGVDVPGVIEVGATKSATMGKRSSRNGSASAISRSTVARVSLGDGQLVITGIRSEARVDKSSSGKLTPKGSSAILEITGPDGKTYDLLPGRTLKIPGLAVITAGKIVKQRNKIMVTAVHIELFPGTAGASIVELGVSEAKLSPRS